jgi:hypothetical protein
VRERSHNQATQSKTIVSDASTLETLNQQIAARRPVAPSTDRTSVVLRRPDTNAVEFDPIVRHDPEIV